MRHGRVAAPAAPSPRHAAQGGAAEAARTRTLPAGVAGVDAARPAARIDRLRELLVPLQGVALAPEVWERDVHTASGRRLLARLARSAVRERRARMGRGGALGRAPGRVALLFREDARWLGPPPFKGERPAEPLHDTFASASNAAPRSGPTCSRISSARPPGWRRSGTSSGPVRSRRRVRHAAARRASRSPAASRSRPARARAAGAPPGAGPLVAHREPVRGSAGARAAHSGPLRGAARVQDRHPRDGLAEGISGVSGLYSGSPTWRRSALRGSCFVEGLGGAQFALPAAIERLLAALRRARGRARAGGNRPR